MKKNKKRISENEIIYKYLKKLSFNKKESFHFMNDGAIIKLKKNHDIIVTNDSIIEEIDFFKNDSPESIAQKIIAYNLSDLSSMGAIPFSYTLCIGFKNNLSKTWVEKFCKKLLSIQKKYNFFLLGGDIGKTKQINISANFFGYVKKNKIIRRDTNNLGDSVWVSGNLGESYIGLMIKQKKIFVNKKLKNYFIKKYLFPKPCMLGKDIINYTSSCIDISDGFIGDLSKLFKINKTNKGVDLNYSKIPFSINTKHLIYNNKVNKFSLLNGGDDYELIFTCNPKNDKKILNIALKKGIKITKVGRIIEKNGIYINGIKMSVPNNSFQYYF